MSSASDLEPYEFSESSSGSSSLLPSFTKSATGVRSAAPKNIDPTDLHLNLLAALALAQHYHIDLLPISWQPALETGLSGGTAKLSEALINLQLNLLFKRLKPHALNTAHTFKALMSEMLVLAQPAIVNHPNILKLEGICWEVSPRNHDVSPVLVFERAQYGDLRSFLSGPDSQKLPFQDRVRICNDIGNAISSMHASHVIHGDIKPENILIFRSKAGKLVAKVSDFGFSTIASTSSVNNDILLPRSRPWYAPEWHRRGFRFTDAVKTDIFSFGLLALFILFEDKLLKDSDVRGSALETFRRETGNLLWNDTDKQNYCIKELKLRADLQDYVSKLVEDVDSLSDQRRADFRGFFRSSLEFDPGVRIASFQLLMPLLAGERDPYILSPMMPLPKGGGTITPLPLAIEHTKQPSLHQNFELSQSVFSLAKAKYWVRKYLVKCFEEQAGHHGCESCRRNAAFQLSLCCMIGFGIEFNEAQSMLWLESSGRQLEDLIDQVQQVRTVTPDWPYFNERMNDLHGYGFLNTVDHTEDLPQAEMVARIISTYSEEIQSLSKAIGSMHPTVLVLRDILERICRARGDLEQSANMRKKLSEDLALTDGFGPDHLDTLASASDLAEIYRLQGLYDLASSTCRLALQGRECQLGKTHAMTMVSVNNLALIVQAQGKDDEAEILNQRLLSQREQTLGPDHPATLTSMTNLASVLQSSEKYEEAIELHERVVQSCQRGFGADHVTTLISLSNLASALSVKGHLAMAEQKLREASRGFEKVFGTTHPYTLTAMGNLASVLQLSQNYAESEQLYRLTFKEQSIILGRDHPEALTTATNLALVLFEEGQLDAAQQLHEGALAGRTKTLGEDHVTTLKSMGHLAATLQAKGDHATAEAFHRRALTGLKMRLGSEHLETLACLQDLAVTIKEQNKLEESGFLFRELSEIYEKKLGLDHPSTIDVLSNLASVLDGQGKYALAEDVHRRVLSGINALWGEDSPDSPVCYENLAMVLQEQDKHEEALPLHQQALRIAENRYGRDDPDTLGYMRNVATAHQVLRQFDAAESMYQRELETRRTRFGAQDSDTVEAMELLAEVLGKAGKLESAIEMALQVCDTHDATLGQDDRRTLTAVRHLASLFHEQGRYEEAGAAYQRACNGFERVLSEDHPARKECVRRYKSMVTEMTSQQ